jgi:outer membrane protein
MRKAARLAALALMAVWSGAAAANAADDSMPPGMTLQDVLGIAYETNPQLAADQAGLRASDEDVAKANANWRPQISATGTYGYEAYTVTGVPGLIGTHPLNAQLGLTEELFRGGRTYAEVQKAKAQVRAGRAQLLASEQTVLLAAATAYMDVVRDEAIVNLRRQNVEVLRQQRDETALEFKAGSLTRTDVAQSEARLATANADLITAEGQLQISRSNFVQTVGRPAETLQPEPGLPAILPASEDDTVTLALKQNPALVAAQQNEIAAGYAVEDAIGAMLPDVSVQGGYAYSQQSYNSTLGAGQVTHGFGLMGQVNIPLYQGGAEEAAVRQAKEQHSQALLNVDVTDRQVRDAVASAWQTFQAARATIASNQATADADEIAFTGVHKEQQAGGGRTVLDVLNAQQELLNAQVAVVTSRRDATVAAYQVLAAEGSLTARALGLKVKLYDPLEHYDSDAARWVGLGD